MPQMSPLNWSILFLYFLTLLMMILFKIYFIDYPKNKESIENNISQNVNMKWQW